MSKSLALRMRAHGAAAHKFFSIREETLSNLLKAEKSLLTDGTDIANALKSIPDYKNVPAFNDALEQIERVTSHLEEEIKVISILLKGKE